MERVYKSENVTAAPIRVIQLLYNAWFGNLLCKQMQHFQTTSLILNAHHSSFLSPWETAVRLIPYKCQPWTTSGEGILSLPVFNHLKELPRFKHILQPIADVCIAKEQQEPVDFESFFTHTIFHECCHGIGPHTITLPNGQNSTVRLELQELHSALEEAKADIVGLWALRFLIHQDLLPKGLLKSMYVSFLAGCFRSVRFGLQEAHGKGQALHFNWLYDKGALHPDETFSVDFSKVEGAVESLSREILTIQAKGDKEAANLLLQKYSKMMPPLMGALQKLEDIQGDGVFLSPAWGGPSYTSIEIFTLDFLKPKDGFTIFQVAQAITPNIIMFLPRCVDLHQVEELSWLSSPPLEVEVEENYVHNNIKGVTAYFRLAACG
ncbi:Nudix hydrolase 3 [Morella rubra]|uniref:Trimethylguanosine synthase n=1 Tax=Morella rubra TaxID=262757 RepID=A0A6A1UIR2_9ROSI|nr:Nudix hydrolase 3 [Morella rubra]